MIAKGEIIMMKKLTVLLAGAMLMIGIATSAQALMLTMSSGADSVSFSNGSNVINYTGTLNGIEVGWAYSNVAPGLGTFDLGTLVFKGTGTITFLLTDSGLILNAPSLTPNVIVTQALSYSYSGVGTTISGDVLINGNSVSGIASTITGNGALIGAGAITTSGLATIGNSFSLAELVTVNLGSSPASVSFDSLVTVAPVPEPGTMVLLGAGLLGLAIFGKRRMNQA